MQDNHNKASRDTRQTLLAAIAIFTLRSYWFSHVGRVLSIPIPFPF